MVNRVLCRPHGQKGISIMQVKNIGSFPMAGQAAGAAAHQPPGRFYNDSQKGLAAKRLRSRHAGYVLYEFSRYLVSASLIQPIPAKTVFATFAYFKIAIRYKMKSIKLLQPDHYAGVCLRVTGHSGSTTRP